MEQTTDLILRLKKTLNVATGEAYTNQEIGNLVGVSRQAIAQAIHDKNGRCRRCLRPLKRPAKDNRT